MNKLIFGNMENQIEKFDPSKLMDGVKDRIRATFVSLIPDDAWSSMVEKELYVFTTGKIITHHEYKGTDSEGKSIYMEWEERKPYDQQPITDNYGNVVKGAGDNISPLQKMIRDMLEEKFRADLKAYLASEEYQGLWQEYGLPNISKALEEILIKNSGIIFQNMIAGMIQSGFDFMRNNIMSSLQGQGYRQY